ncbi:MAG: AI-2E family transporter [Deltaproteobacteria bacterium]|nr:AI-2E family transporter [Deltaproteobacteria bacterium]
MTLSPKPDEGTTLPTREDRGGGLAEAKTGSERVEATSGRSPSFRVYVGLLAVAIFAVAYTLQTFVSDFVLALVFAALAAPLHQRLAARLGGRSGLAAALVTALVVVLVAVPTTFMITSLTKEGAHLYEASRGSFSSAGIETFLFGDGTLAKNARRVAESLGVDYSPESAKAAAAKIAGAVVAFIYDRVNAFVANLLAAGFHFLIFLLILFYLLVDGVAFRAFAARISPLAEEDHELLGSTFNSVGRAILIGNVLASVLQGVAGAIAWIAVGLPSAVLWGTIMAILAFLPMVGISLVTIPATLYLGLGEDRWGAAIVFFLVTAAVAFFLDNVVKTRLMGTHMKMHDALIFLSVIGGIGAFGLLGLLYGPLVVALFQTVAELYAKRARVA